MKKINKFLEFINESTLDLNYDSIIDFHENLFFYIEDDFDIKESSKEELENHLRQGDNCYYMFSTLPSANQRNAFNTRDEFVIGIDIYLYLDKEEDRFRNPLYDDDFTILVLSKYTNFKSEIHEFLKSSEKFLQERGFDSESDSKILKKFSTGQLNERLRFVNFKVRITVSELNEKELELKTLKFLKNMNWSKEEIKKFKELNIDLDSDIIHESTKVKNISIEDIIEAIKKGSKIFATIIKNFPNNNPDEPLTPVSVDDDGLVTINFNGSEYEVELKNVERVEI
jgi:hypothetical protein